MIPQGGIIKRQHLLQQRKTPVAAVAVCRNQKSKRVIKEASSMGIQMSKGGKGRDFQWKQTTELLRTPLISMHVPKRICRKTGTNIPKQKARYLETPFECAISLWKHRAEGLRRSCSASSPVGSAGLLSVCFFITSLLPFSLLHAYGQLLTSLTEATGNRWEGKQGLFTLFPPLFFFSFFHCHSSGIALEQFLPWKTFNISEGNLTFHYLIPLPDSTLLDHSVQTQSSTRFINHRAPQSLMADMTWEKDKEGRRMMHFISQ